MKIICRISHLLVGLLVWQYIMGSYWTVSYYAVWLCYCYRILLNEINHFNNSCALEHSTSGDKV